MAVQWLRIHASTAGHTGSIPGQGLKIPHTAKCDQEKDYGLFYFLDNQLFFLSFIYFV